MAIVKELKCLAHGPFESTAKDPVCPYGCTVVIREFRTAPGTRSTKTKQSDAALERLAKRFGLSDMSNKNGSVANSRKERNPMTPQWAAMPKGNTYEVGKGEVPVDGSEGGASSALAGLRIAENNDGPNFMDIAKGLPKPRPIVAKDHVFGTARDLQEAIEKAP